MTWLLMWPHSKSDNYMHQEEWKIAYQLFTLSKFVNLQEYQVITESPLGEVFLKCIIKTLTEM